MSLEKEREADYSNTGKKQKKKAKRRSLRLRSLSDYPVETSEEKNSSIRWTRILLKRAETNDEETALSDPMTSDEDAELFTFEPDDNQYIAQKRS